MDLLATCFRLSGITTELLQPVTRVRINEFPRNEFSLTRVCRKTVFWKAKQKRNRKQNTCLCRENVFWKAKQNEIEKQSNTFRRRRTPKQRVSVEMELLLSYSYT